MSDRLSKGERKRLRRQAEEEIRQKEFARGVVSPKATPKFASPEAIVREARAVGVNLAHRPAPDGRHVFGIPDGPPELSVTLSYLQTDPAMRRSIADFEWLVDDRSQLADGSPVAFFSGKPILDPAIDFLMLTLTRVLGRLAGGVLINEGNRTVMDDWLAWSLDYMDPDMFKVTRVYDNPPPDFTGLLKRFPSLRWTGPVADTPRKPWWKFW